jgi:arginine exporter protein ArgO
VKVLLRVVSVIFWLIALFLIGVSISVLASGTSGIRWGVLIAYIVGAVILTWLGVLMWRRHSRGSVVS